MSDDIADSSTTPIKKRRSKRSSKQQRTSNERLAATTLGSGGRLTPLDPQALERIHVSIIEINICRVCL